MLLSVFVFCRPRTHLFCYHILSIRVTDFQTFERALLPRTIPKFVYSTWKRNRLLKYVVGILQPDNERSDEIRRRFCVAAERYESLPGLPSRRRP